MPVPSIPSLNRKYTYIVGGVAVYFEGKRYNPGTIIVVGEGTARGIIVENPGAKLDFVSS
jgi:hypothetical protein